MTTAETMTGTLAPRTPLGRGGRMSDNEAGLLDAAHDLLP